MVEPMRLRYWHDISRPDDFFEPDDPNGQTDNRSFDLTSEYISGRSE